jgi:hypothetical protein
LSDWQGKKGKLKNESQKKEGKDSIKKEKETKKRWTYPIRKRGLVWFGSFPRRAPFSPRCTSPSGLVWEMEDSSGWKRIEGDFGKC